MDEIKQNPYDLGGQSTNRSGSNSPAFRKKKGYYQHIIDVQRLNSKKNLKFYRDGNQYIKKAENDNEWFVKDPNEKDHCHHHDDNFMEM